MCRTEGNSGGDGVFVTTTDPGPVRASSRVSFRFFNRGVLYTRLVAGSDRKSPTGPDDGDRCYRPGELGSPREWMSLENGLLPEERLPSRQGRRLRLDHDREQLRVDAGEGLVLLP